MSLEKVTTSHCHYTAINHHSGMHCDSIDQETFNVFAISASNHLIKQKESVEHKRSDLLFQVC